MPTQPAQHPCCCYKNSTAAKGSNKIEQLSRYLEIEQGGKCIVHFALGGVFQVCRPVISAAARELLAILAITYTTV